MILIYLFIILFSVTSIMIVIENLNATNLFLHMPMYRELYYLFISVMCIVLGFQYYPDSKIISFIFCATGGAMFSSKVRQLILQK
jgi:hypothetical protein